MIAGIDLDGDSTSLPIITIRFDGYILSWLLGREVY